ncbi:UbiD-like decarboxylase [Mycolicibacterium murale]|jgi:UbiD family decarboxylase|uniref:UbiD-like decarboxylase n=1 Tax=Mycolicibacterium murale TaxID=182220 RepID=A0A7I9WR93_9MYCO|nr:UbiD family decarboxylase [Mycolicibacterium murale]MCV7183610.1 UbiD family decarboxylase [Mycolicibacterium murale]GFG59858.1 UbiD-like decarboxylase [Mycolicibacterium murale]
MSAHIDRNKIPRSYREYLTLMKDMGELVEIDDEVDWNLEMGAIFRHAAETCAPMPVFNRVKDAAPGFRAADWGMGKSGHPTQPWRRLAAMLGLPPETPLMEIQAAYIDAKENSRSYPPNVVDASQAPCKQNKWTGDQIDLNKIPAPLAHDGDGGRYLQTAGLNIARTPDGRWTNWSTNRAVILDAQTMTGQWWPKQHNGMIWKMWRDQGKDMPWACALGVSPVASTQAASRIPAWVDEYDMASALLGAPLDMVQCETSDILVPADAEIIIEGIIEYGTQEPEGPFGEYPGYLPDETTMFPRQKVTCVTFRNEPILPMSIPGVPIDNCHVTMGFFISSDSVVTLQKAGLPIIDGMYLFEAAILWFVIRVPKDWHDRTGWTLDHFMNRLGNTFWTDHVGDTVTKILVVDEDIDPSDVKQVVWAFASRNHPTFTTYLFPELRAFGDGIESYHTMRELAEDKGTSLVIYSCLENADRIGRPQKRVMSFQENYPAPVKQKVLDNWERWGFTTS